MQLFYERLRQGEVQIIVGAQHVVPLPVYFIYLKYAVNYNPLHCLPSAEDLPDSDDEPVDNQLQHLIPGLLEAILPWLWVNRMDWFFGVDVGIYYDLELPPIVPNGFLNLRVERVFGHNLRLSYRGKRISVGVN